MTEIAYVTACTFSIIWPNVICSLPIFGTEWSRESVRLILSTRRLVKTWTGHCNERNSSQIDDNYKHDDDDEYDDAYDDDDKDNNEDSDNSSSDGNGDDGDNEGYNSNVDDDVQVRNG